MRKDILQYIKSVNQQGMLTIISLAKNITFKNISEVQEEFARVTERKDIRNILFDLKEVTEADSSGLAVLIDLLKYMKTQHVKGKIGLFNLTTKMKSLLEVSKVENLFHEYASKEEAIKELS